MDNRDKERALAAMARLNGHPDFQTFREFTLEGALKNETEKCTVQDNPARAQGAVIVLQKILNDLDHAAETYRKLKGVDTPIDARTSY